MADKFCHRFQIQIPLEDAKRRFVNRAHNEILQGNAFWVSDIYHWTDVYQQVATHLGEFSRSGEGLSHGTLERYTGKDFARTLEALEGVYGALDQHKRAKLDIAVCRLLDMSEIDLQVDWKKGRFYPTGARELDARLLNDSLDWLGEQEYLTVLRPFEKALDHLLRARAKPELLSDVVTDAYEALEALAKIVTGKDQTLDANHELFLAKICTSDEYKQVLNDCLKKYRPFAHSFRHGAATPAQKPSICYAEAESFVYLTGVFIRLAISTSSPALAATVAP